MHGQSTAMTAKRSNPEFCPICDELELPTVVALRDHLAKVHGRKLPDAKSGPTNDRGTFYRESSGRERGRLLG